MKPDAKQPIPVTPLLRLYRTLRVSRQELRLKEATKLLANTNHFAARVSESIERFAMYDNVGEAFCLPHEPLKAPEAIVNGRTLAAALAQGEQHVGGANPFSFRLVDYEVRPARTTKSAPLMLNQFEDGRPSTASMSIDLLLRHEDGRPIVGEAKVAKVHGYDTDSFLALVQALAAATQLATPNQRQRLARHYPADLRAAEPLDIAVIAYHPQTLANATFQSRLDAAARNLADALLHSAAFPSQIRSIHFIGARGPPSKLEISIDEMGVG